MQAELATNADGRVVAHLVRGEAHLEGDEAPQMAPRTIAWQAAQPDAAAVVEPLADGEVQRIVAWTTPKKPAQGPGQLVVDDAQSGSATRLLIARYHVHVVLQPPVALVQIDQAFYNPLARQTEGTFIFNLPPGASVSRFAMYVTAEQLIEGELVERGRATQIYDSIVRRQRDPAILEQIGDNLFKMRVFPVPAGDVKRILLDYTVPLVPDGGEYRFRLPLLSDLEPIWDFLASGVIGPQSAAGKLPYARVGSPSHAQIEFHQADDGTVEFSLAQKDYQPGGDLLLHFSEAGDQELRLFAYRPEPRAGLDARDDETTYFLARIRPPGRPGPLPPADLLILADTSSSIIDRHSLRAAVAHIVHNLGAGDRFQLGCVDVAFRPLTLDWTAPAAAEATAALTKLDEQVFLGDTDLEAGFEAALDDVFSAERGDRRKLVVYLGDGVGTAGNLAGLGPRGLVDWLDEQLSGAGIGLFVYLLAGDQGGDAPLASLARSCGGRLFDGREPAATARELLAWLASGMPTNARLRSIELDGQRVSGVYYEADPSGDGSFHVLGRASRPGEHQLTVTTTARLDDLRSNWTLDLKPDDRDMFLGRLWAQRRLDQLRQLSAVQAAEEHQALNSAQVALSQEWSLLSPQTAFLVLETEQDYARWNIDRRARRRYWKPAEAMTSLPLKVLTRLAGSPAIDRAADERRFQETLAKVERLLGRHEHALAWTLLQNVRWLAPAAGSEAYASASNAALTGLRRESLLDRLGVHRRLIDPSAAIRPSPVQIDGTQLIATSLSSEFLRLHPHAEQYLHEVRLPEASLTLDNWVEWVADETGLNVVIDQNTLNGTTELAVQGSGRMAIGNFLRHLLATEELVAVDQPHRLLITTKKQAENILTTHLYPLGDLLLSDGLAPAGMLQDPYLDRDDTAERRIRAKLKRPMTVSYKNTPLGDVLEQFAELLGDNLVIDSQALRDAGVVMERGVRAGGPQTRVNGTWHDVPAGDSLQWILDGLGLTYEIRHEALVVTARTEAENHIHIRLHSGRGVVHQVPALSGRNQNPGGAMVGGMGRGGSFGGGGPIVAGAMAGFGGAGSPPANGAAGMGVAPAPAQSRGGDAGAIGNGDRTTSTPLVISVIPVVADPINAPARQFINDSTNTLETITTNANPSRGTRPAGQARSAETCRV